MIYTDGVIEAMAADEPFGRPRLAKKALDLSASRVFGEVGRFERNLAFDVNRLRSKYGPLMTFPEMD